jgi:hypothetical protein
VVVLYFAYYWLTILGNICFSQRHIVCGLKASFDTKNLKEVADFMCESLNTEGTMFGLLIHLYLNCFFFVVNSTDCSKEVTSCFGGYVLDFCV